MIRCRHIAGISLAINLLMLLPCSGFALAGKAYDPDALEALRERIQAGDVDDAEAEARAILVEVEREEGSRSLAVADVISVIVEALWSGPEPGAPAAIALAERAVAITEAEAGPVHMETAKAINNLGTLHFEAGRYEIARPLLERSLAIRRELYGPDHEIVARGLNNLSRLLYRAGDLEGSIEGFKQSLAIIERTSGPESERAGTLLTNIGVLTMELGRYEESIAQYERALAILEQQHGPEHPTVARVLNNLAIATELTGNYAEARALYERCLTMRRKILPPDDLETASTHHNLAVLNYTIGDLDGALEEVTQAVEIYEKGVGAEHSETLRMLNTYATILDARGETGRAIEVHERTLAAREKTLGPEHHDVAESRSALAVLYLEQGAAEKALPLFRRSLAAREKSLGEDHPVVAVDLGYLARAQSDLGRLSEARAYLDRALAIRERRLGPDHPETAASLVQLAELYWQEGKRKEALAPARRAFRILQANARETLAVLPERQALLHVASQVRPEEILFSGLLASGDKGGPWIEACWEWSLGRRGLVLDVLAERHRSALSDESEQTRTAWRELADARRALAELWVAGVEGVDQQSYRAALDEARRRREQAETALARASVSYRGEQQLLRTSIADLALALPAETALVEMVRVRAGPGRSGTRETHDVALVIVPGSASRFVDLGRSAAIDEAVTAWRASLDRSAQRLDTSPPNPEDSSGAIRSVRTSGERLRRLVWDPLPIRARTARRLFLVPDGAVHLIDLAALPGEDGGYLIEQGPAVQLLSSARDLVRITHEEGRGSGRGHGLLALGDPDFDADRFARRIEAQENMVVAYRGEAPDCLALAGTAWPSLPESGREVLQVSELFGSDEPVIRLTGAGASEERFKREASGRRVLHLATHGFFLDDECATESGVAMRQSDSPLAENPLLRSGLVLAGANRSVGRAAADDDGEDGFLTAEELAALDLRGVDLAVLSACDTGRGEVAVGEGVFGLRRALQIAGVRSMVMSLWPVPDRQARRWMTRFYTSRLDGASISDASRQASLANLRELRELDMPEHPYDWAGLVTAGDWR